MWNISGQKKAGRHFVGSCPTDSRNHLGLCRSKPHHQVADDGGDQCKKFTSRFFAELCKFVLIFLVRFVIILYLSTCVYRRVENCSLIF